VHHLERAFRIKVIDPELAVFRAITAEEEGGTAIFLGLKEQGYHNASKIRFKDHAYKQALEPFLRAISKAIEAWWNEPGFPFRSEYSMFLNGQGSERRLSLSFQFQGQAITCIPPLGFSIKQNDERYFFKQELLEIASGDSRLESSSMLSAWQIEEIKSCMRKRRGFQMLLATMDFWRGAEQSLLRSCGSMR
jgi:hypothetical protein